MLNEKLPNPNPAGTSERLTPTPGLGSPSAEQVLAHLERVLQSSAFSGAPRQQRLLRHLVTNRLQGATSELKEYALGVEVFDRGDNFDPRLDPIVRVEASRLRTRLQKYYEGSGAGEQLRISIPRGAYLPSFVTVDNTLPAPPEVPQATEEEQEPPPMLPMLAMPPIEVPKSRRSIIGYILFGAALVALSISTNWLFHKTGGERPTPPNFVKFSRVTSDGAVCASPTFSPDGKALVYAKRQAGKWDLYRCDLNGMSFRNLTQSSPANNEQPAWSPDGKWIAFRRDRESGGLFLLDTETQAISRLTNYGYSPAWSPDSRRIVFSTETFKDPAETAAADPGSLQVIDLATRQVRPLGAPDPNHDALQPAWSPHGNRVAFWGTDRNGERDVWTVDADATNGKPLDRVPVTHDSWTDWSPAWSPDGHYLYFSSDRGGAMNLWRVRVNEKTGGVLGRPEAVTTPSSYSGWTAFAPNGKEFAYVHRLVSSQLYKAPFTPAGGIQFEKKTQLTAGERSVREPETSPDGSWIVLRVQDPQEDLALIRPDGTGLHRITNDAFNDRSPHWSPDGKQIVFLSNRSGRFEVWSIHPDGSGLRQLTRNGSMPCVWTPDGILLGYAPDGKTQVLDPPGAKPFNWGIPSSFRPLAWSPNKDSVAGRMRSTAFGRAALFIFTRSAEDYWQIAPNAPFTSTVWLKDGESLLFSRDDGIFLADLRTRQLHQQTSTGAAGAAADMHSRFTLSRDNESVFFILSDDEDDIWIGSE
jgi:Tol biopolymer transport system component